MENNFNLRKFLVENKLTVGSKQIKEGSDYGYERTMNAVDDMFEPGTPEHDKLTDAVEDAFHKGDIDYSEYSHSPSAPYQQVAAIAREIGLDEAKKEDSMEEATTLSSRVDQSSITLGDVHTWDYPDFADAYIEYAEFNDGTPLSDEELNQLNDEMSDDINQLAHDSLYEGLSKKERVLKEAVLKALK
jgi:hypothetical protein